MITDAKGAIYQHLEYFPYGETWIEEGGSYGGNTPGYKFTGKELDPETGLYYFGARYYEPKLSKWISADPILGDYLSVKGTSGGLIMPVNFALYTYAHLNPVKLVDPNGESVFAFEFDKSSQYGTVALIWNGWLPDGVFRINSRADNGSGIASGVYSYKVGTHPIDGGKSNRYFTDHGNATAGLNLYNDSKLTDRNLPALPGKPNGESTFGGVNLHPGNKMKFDKNGDVATRSGSVTTGSDGCMTVPVVKAGSYQKDAPDTWSNYQDVTKEFKAGDEGKFILMRPSQLIDWAKNKIQSL